MSIQLSEEQIKVILNEINELFLSSSIVLECVDFMPSVEPPYVLYAEKTIGIAYGVIKPLFRYLYQNSLLALQNYNHSNQIMPQSSDTWVELITRVLLLLKGDLSFIYNLRKRIILNNPQYLTKEIPLLKVIFSKHPKSPSGWEHRRWCYYQRQRGKLDQTPFREFHLSLMEVITEQELCKIMAEKYPKNYYAWMHRLWLLPSCEFPQIEDEITFTKSWMLSHPSDHSAVNHRLQVIHRILDRSNELHCFLNSLDRAQIRHDIQNPSFQFILYFFEESVEIIEKYSTYESLWQYKKLLFLLLVHQFQKELIVFPQECPSWFILNVKGYLSCSAINHEVQIPEERFIIWYILNQEICQLSTILSRNSNDEQAKFQRLGSRFLDLALFEVLRKFDFQKGEISELAKQLKTSHHHE